MANIVNHRNNLFVVDEAQLKPEARKPAIINALYAAIYSEFKGAAKHPSYRNLTALERMQAVNDFANKWLKERGLK